MLRPIVCKSYWKFKLQNFQLQNSLKNKYLSHVSSENCEINSLKFDSPKVFQHQECLQISKQFLALILFNFHWENGSTVNGFYTIVLNNLKPSCQCTPTHQELSKNTKITTWNTVIWEILAMTKQNKLPCFIDKYA
jgi:hypothetical protein